MNSNVHNFPNSVPEVVFRELRDARQPRFRQTRGNQIRQTT